MGKVGKGENHERAKPVGLDNQAVVSAEPLIKFAEALGPALHLHLHVATKDRDREIRGKAAARGSSARDSLGRHALVARSVRAPLSRLRRPLIGSLFGWANTSANFR